MLHSQLAWYVAGPVMGLCVVACRLLFNGRLGVTGGVSEVVGQVTRGSARFDWRAWFLFGVVLAGAVSLLVFGGPTFHGYGWLTQTFHGTGRILIVPITFGAGILIGYGAKLSGGCTSGNGLSGTAQLSLASLAATATFFATGILVTVVIEALR